MFWDHIQQQLQQVYDHPRYAISTITSGWFLLAGADLAPSRTDPEPLGWNLPNGSSRSFFDWLAYHAGRIRSWLKAFKHADEFLHSSQALRDAGVLDGYANDALLSWVLDNFPRELLDNPQHPVHILSGILGHPEFVKAHARAKQRYRIFQETLNFANN
jgi:hypothetical protein